MDLIQQKKLLEKPFLTEIKFDNLINLIHYFETFDFINDNLEPNLKLLNEDIQKFDLTLNSYYDPLPKENILKNYLNWIKDGKTNLDKLVNLMSKIDIFLNGILDIVEINLSPKKSKDNFDNNLIQYNTLIDLIDLCINRISKLKLTILLIKNQIDISTEFWDIFYDTMDTIHKLIKDQVKICFKLHEDKFSSPMRHTPTFSLKKLIDLLNNKTENLNYKLPTFSPIDEVIYREYMELITKLDPIEMSLMKILPERIKTFKTKNDNLTISNNNDIIKFIKNLGKNLDFKFDKILIEYKFMIQEVQDLKRELIDKRWNILFINLVNEIEFLIEEIKLIMDKFNNFRKRLNDRKISEQLIKLLNNKSDVIDKTFKVINKAIELSLLNGNIIKRINSLNLTWQEKKDKVKLLIEEQSTTNDLTRIYSNNSRKKNSIFLDSTMINSNSGSTRSSIYFNNNNNMNELELKTSKSDKRISSGNRIGVALLNKMNYQPVIVTGTPFSAEKPKDMYYSKTLSSPSPTSTVSNRLSKMIMLNQITMTNEPLSPPSSIMEEEVFPNIVNFNKREKPHFVDNNCNNNKDDLEYSPSLVKGIVTPNSPLDNRRRNRTFKNPDPEALNILEETLRRLEGNGGEEREIVEEDEEEDDNSSLLLYQQEETNPFIQHRTISPPNYSSRNEVFQRIFQERVGHYTKLKSQIPRWQHGTAQLKLKESNDNTLITSKLQKPTPISNFDIRILY